MIELKYRCPDCWTVWKVGQMLVKEGLECDTRCPECHKRRVTEQRVRTTQFVSNLPPIQEHPYSSPPMVLEHHDCGRRVVRKSESMGG